MKHYRVVDKAHEFYIIEVLNDYYPPEGNKWEYLGNQHYFSSKKAIKDCQKLQDKENNPAIPRPDEIIYEAK